MFFTYAEKEGGTFFSQWRTREVAFDTTRRYLYYSDKVQQARHPQQPSTSTPTNIINNTNSTTSNTRSESQPSASPSSPPAISSEETAVVHQTVWKKKIKVTGVVPVSTVRPMDFLYDPLAEEGDLYALEITGESRQLATGEGPPIGPLLCPSADIVPMPTRWSVDNEEYVKDPFFLKELFEALRAQFENMDRERAAAEQEAAAAGRATAQPARPQTSTLQSPRGARGDTFSTTRERIFLRCRDERECRRLWFVIQSVLGYDKLAVRPYRGLPPYDPRNGISFAHIPMIVWHTFEALDKAVFYTFSRGDVMEVDPETGKSSVAIPGCYVCITHDMVMFMRDTGNIPLWLRLHDVEAFHHNSDCETPFVTFLCDAPSPDVIFVPQPPVYGPRAIAQHNPRYDVSRIRRVMHDACFASLDIRRVTHISACSDSTVSDYVRRLGREGTRPLRLRPVAGFSSTLSCPLPKEQLAAVWQEVQADLRARGDVTNRAAIPIYASNANALLLTHGQLTAVSDALEEERIGRHEIVGMPLERARQLPAPSPSSPTQLTASMLATPQIAGSRHHTNNNNSRVREGSVASSSEESSYLQPGSRYLTREEVQAEQGNGSPLHVLVDNNVECTSTRSVRSEGVSQENPSRTTQFKFGPERTVNEIVSRSMAAMASSTTGEFTTKE